MSWNKRNKRKRSFFPAGQCTNDRSLVSSYVCTEVVIFASIYAFIMWCLAQKQRGLLRLHVNFVYMKITIISVNHTNFSIVKNTFKAATCFDSTEPSSGLILRTDPHHFSSTFGIPSVYIDGVVITCAMLFFYIEVKKQH